MRAPDIEIRRVGPDQLADYARTPISYQVESVFTVEMVDAGLGGIKLREEEVPRYVKHGDSYEDGGPENWPGQFDIAEWGLFLALQGGFCVGGAAVAFDAPGIRILHERNDVAALWDLRVRPELRRTGIGTRLFERAATWARDRGFKQLRVETQNVNVPACRFYAARGCELGEVDRYFYHGHPEVGHEIMLGWYLDLS